MPYMRRNVRLMKATLSLPGVALLLVLAILGSCQNQAIAQGKPTATMRHVAPAEAGSRSIGSPPSRG